MGPSHSKREMMKLKENLFVSGRTTTRVCLASHRGRRKSPPPAPKRSGEWFLEMICYLNYPWNWFYNLAIEANQFLFWGAFSSPDRFHLLRWEGQVRKLVVCPSSESVLFVWKLGWWFCVLGKLATDGKHWQTPLKNWLWDEKFHYGLYIVWICTDGEVGWNLHHNLSDIYKRREIA